MKKFFIFAFTIIQVLIHTYAIDTSFADNVYVNKTKDVASKRSGFDNRKEVLSAIKYNTCSIKSLCTGFMVSYYEDQKEYLFIRVKINDGDDSDYKYFEITDTKFSIDGEIINLTKGLETQFYNRKESYQDFYIKLSHVEKMLLAKKVWMRVYTDRGVTESCLIENGKKSESFKMLERFMKVVHDDKI